MSGTREVEVTVRLTVPSYFAADADGLGQNLAQRADVQWVDTYDREETGKVGVTWLRSVETTDDTVARDVLVKLTGALERLLTSGQVVTHDDGREIVVRLDTDAARLLRTVVDLHVKAREVAVHMVGGLD